MSNSGTTSQTNSGTHLLNSIYKNKRPSKLWLRITFNTVRRQITNSLCLYNYSSRRSSKKLDSKDNCQPCLDRSRPSCDSTISYLSTTTTASRQSHQLICHSRRNQCRWQAVCFSSPRILTTLGRDLSEYFITITLVLLFIYLLITYFK